MQQTHFIIKLHLASSVTGRDWIFLCAKRELWKVRGNKKKSKTQSELLSGNYNLTENAHYHHILTV